MVRLSAGEIRFDGRSITRAATPAIVRGGLAQVPERRQLFGPMTVEENLKLGAYTRSDRVGIAATLGEQFRQFPILRERRYQSSQTLSGGEQQMLAIARAMMSQPKLLLLDEPSLGLAPLMVARIMDQIVALRAAGGTVLIVEQNARAALDIADRGYVLENGSITVAGKASSSTHQPRRAGRLSRWTRGGHSRHRGAHPSQAQSNSRALTPALGIAQAKQMTTDFAGRADFRRFGRAISVEKQMGGRLAAITYDGDQEVRC